MAARKTKRKGVIYKSRFEAFVAAHLEKEGLPVLYENEVLEYVVPMRVGKYHPDFQIGPKTFIESKGRWVAEDRKKHLLLKEQLEPKGYKIYLLFSNSRQKISKRSNTTYADWCDKQGIEWADKVPKKEWFDGLGENEDLGGRKARGRKRKDNDRVKP
jgi:hypothetical protein